MKLSLRGKIWHLRRRVLRLYAVIEPRCEVWVSVKTDSHQLAIKKAPEVWESLVAGWEAQLDGRSEDQIARFQATRAIADSHGVSFKPIRDVEDLPLSQLNHSDFLDFRSWWLEHIAEEEMTPGSANKDLIHLGKVLLTLTELKGFEFDPPLQKLGSRLFVAS